MRASPNSLKVWIKYMSDYDFCQNICQAETFEADVYMAYSPKKTCNLKIISNYFKSRWLLKLKISSQN